MGRRDREVKVGAGVVDESSNPNGGTGGGQCVEELEAGEEPVARNVPRGGGDRQDNPRKRAG